MKNLNFSLSLLALCAGAVMVTPAMAQQTYEQSTYTIPENGRSMLRAFIEQERDRACDAAEAGSPKPCVTPEQQVNIVQPGGILPPEVNVVPVPDDVTGRISDTPNQTRYVYAASNVYLMDINTRRVIDVVTLPAP
ncbi:MAG TPA: hypothetical protein VEF76_01230 [Patescibacteria group bacterium]|nr:hypothetical protein [Patescibacteria group bacterium]